MRARHSQDKHRQATSASGQTSTGAAKRATKKGRTVQSARSNAMASRGVAIGTRGKAADARNTGDVRGKAGGTRSQTSDAPRSRAAGSRGVARDGAVGEGRRVPRGKFQAAGGDEPRAARGKFAGRDEPRAARGKFAGRDEPRAERGKFAGRDEPRAAGGKFAGRDEPRAARGKFATTRDEPRGKFAGRDEPRAARGKFAGRDEPRAARKSADEPRAARKVGGRDEPRAARGKFATTRDEPRDKPASKRDDVRKKRSKASGARDEARSARSRARVTREEARPARKKFVRPKPDEVDAEEAPKRVALSAPRGGIQPSDWLFTTREGSEQDLIDELVLANVVQPPAHVLYPSLVVSPRWPKREHQLVPVTFARQALAVQVSVKHADPEVRFEKLVRVLATKLDKAKQYALHVWVPDSTIANPLSSQADELDSRLEAAFAKLLPDAHRVEDGALRRLGSIPFAQVCLATPDHVIGGVHYSNQALSLARGGRTRVRVTGDLPSRAARKIEEALAWLGVSPGPGEVCVDLGAAPGGWTYVLAERKARVIAVDPALLRPEIAARKNVEHVTKNAFNFEPDGRVDWLFCDMAYRPLEVAALLARWGRRNWARHLVANIKLPMTKKAEILARVRTILEREGEWKHVRTRQLYHDRDEITLTALRG